MQYRLLPDRYMTMDCEDKDMSEIKRFTFYGMREIVDVEFADKAREAIRQLIEENDRLEFWFHITGKSYYRVLMEVIALRTCYPQKSISIVNVLENDPEIGNKDNPMGIYYRNRFGPKIPLSLFDRVVVAPFFDCGDSSKPGANMRRFHHTQNWIVEQCDVLISYEYPELFSSESTFLKRYSGKVDMVVSLISEETSAKIVKYISELPEKEKNIMESLLAGKKMSEIAKESKVTKSAIDGKAERAARRIRELIKRDYHKKLYIDKRGSNRKCAVCGLSDNSLRYLQDVIQLVKFMEKELGVEEYYIPKELCFSEVAGPFIAMSREFVSSIKLHAVVPEDDEHDKDFYCPPYSSVLTISNLKEPDFYKNLISDCRYLICDLTTVDDKEILKRYCSETGVSLIDISVLSDQLSTSEENNN